jgi:beta-galactosidase
MSFFSGIVDLSEHIRLGGYPEPFREMLGLDVIDFHPLAADDEVDLSFAEGAQGRGSIWMDEIHPRGADVLATFEGRPAITRHRFGKGTAFYLGTQPDLKSMTRVLELARDAAGMRPAAEMPSGVEVVKRAGAGRTFLFLLNHRDAGVDVRVEEAGVNLVDGSPVHPGLLHLGPRGVAVIREGW